MTLERGSHPLQIVENGNDSATADATLVWPRVRHPGSTACRGRMIPVYSRLVSIDSTSFELPNAGGHLPPPTVSFQIHSELLAAAVRFNGELRVFFLRQKRIRRHRSACAALSEILLTVSRLVLIKTTSKTQ